MFGSVFFFLCFAILNLTVFNFIYVCIIRCPLSSGSPSIWWFNIVLSYLHYSVGGLGWLLSGWHTIVISTDRVIDYVQEFIKSVNVVIRWRATVMLGFL